MPAATGCNPDMGADLAGETDAAMPSSAGAAAETRTASVAAIDVADASRATILVADDEPQVRTVVGEILRRNGYHVLQAADGVEALEIAAQHPGPIHLLLTDISMPRLDGRELHRRLNHQRPETRTVFMSSRVDTGLHPDSAFLPKPFVLPALVSKVSEVLRVNVGRENPEERVG